MSGRLGLEALRRRREPDCQQCGENQLLWAEANWEKAIDSRTGTIRLENLSQNTQTLWATVECGRPASVF